MKKNRKLIMLPAGLLAAVMILCSCLAGIQPRETAAFGVSDMINDNTEINENEIQTANTPLTESSSESAPEVSENYPEENESASGSGQAEENTEDIREPSENYVFDNPDDYLERNENNGELILPEAHKKLCEESMFVGDSICRGFEAYSVAPSENVFAAGSIGARNLLESTVYAYGKNNDFVTVLKGLAPKNIFFWMGMNDVNMTEPEEYCENYRKIIDTSLQNSSAEIYVCAITPIRCEFAENSRLIEFNNAVRDYIEAKYKSRVHFVDFTEPLKAENGELDERFDSSDGIHLNPEAYYIALHEIEKQMKS